MCVCVFFFFANIYVFVFFLSFLGLQGCHISNEKKKTVKGSVGKNIEYLCKMSGFISRNRRARLDFWVVHVQHSRLRIVITFQCRLDFEREVGHLVLVIRSGSPDYLRQTSYKHALKYLEAAR